MSATATEDQQELRALLTELTQEIGQTLATHRHVLESHEANFVAAHKTATNHRGEIQTLQAAVREMGEMQNAQGQLLKSFESALLKIIDHLGLVPPDLPTSSPN